MNTIYFGNTLLWAEPCLCAVGLLIMIIQRQVRSFRFLAAFLVVHLGSDALLIPSLHFSKALHLSRMVAYELYFYSYWTSYAIESLLTFGIIISIYRLAMEPLEGLQQLGMIMFRWAGSISLALAIVVGLGPRVTTSDFIIHAILQLDQTLGILTLSMLLFVCFAIHPMGLSFRSRIFGVMLGLGLMATADLIATAWLSHIPNLYSTVANLGSCVFCVSVAIWSAYFLLPEPERRMILLPTTSPFFRWNQISEVLGDDPGYVAIGKVGADMFAPAELEIMRRASEKMERAIT